MEIELPEILNISDKLLPIITRINDFRYFLLEGGRSSSKSQSVARLLTWLAEQKRLRIICGREIQNTIEESVYAIFKDLIDKYSLAFDVLSTKIDHKQTKSSIRFRGLRDQGAFNIQGLEGVDVLWVDEAQSITKQTLEVIIPTIRKENSKIFFTMNRHVENDPVYSFLVGRKDCLHIHIDYLENKFCPKAMIQEAEAMKAVSIDDYNHIWLGQPLSKSDDYLFSLDALRNSLSVTFNSFGQQKRVMAVDVARFGGDEIVYTILESRGILQWEQIHQETEKHKGIDETVGKIVSMKKAFQLEAIIVDDDGMGGGVTDMLHSFDLTVYPFNGNSESHNEKLTNARTEGYFKLADWIERGWLKILDDSVLHTQLQQIRYKYKPNGLKALISKDEMRKEGIASPDRADALMMAVFFADKVHARINNYEGNTNIHRLPAYAVTR